MHTQHNEIDILWSEAAMDRIMIKPSEAATLLGIGRTKIYELIRANEIPYRRVGKSIRLPLARLKAWAEANEIEAKPEARSRNSD
jgi:excisionase family DNA binding protein